jgi:general secretion pathway protein G
MKRQSSRLLLLLASLSVLGGWLGYRVWTAITAGPVPGAAPLTVAMITRGIAPMLSLHKQHVGEYPTSLQDLLARPQNNPGADRWLGPYVKKVPRDGWGREFCYSCPGQHNPDAYDLWSAGPDGVSGTADDVTNWGPGAVAPATIPPPRIATSQVSPGEDTGPPASPPRASEP